MICLLKKHLNSLSVVAEKTMRPVDIHNNIEKIGTEFRKFDQAGAHEFFCQLINKLDEHYITEMNLILSSLTTQFLQYIHYSEEF